VSAVTTSSVEPQQRLGRAAARMGAVTAVSRGAGFVRVLVIAAVLGTTHLGNTFVSSNSVSNVLFELVAAGALSAVLVPTFVTLLARGDDGACARLAGGLLGWSVVGLGTLSVAGVLAAPWLARLLTAGVDPSVAAQQRELTTYLLRFFVPQIVLYAFGAVATGVLYARRRFAITAAAPIGNTVIMVICLAAFRASAGSNPGFALTSTERLLLAIAGTGGVIAFVGVLVVACVRSGTSLRPRWRPRDPEVRDLLGHAGWGVLLHSIAGLLLGAAIVAGNSVAGGVVAYQAAFVFFLAPYAVLAQPLHTTVLPELVDCASAGDTAAFSSALRLTVQRMALLVAPITAAMLVAALPAMRVIAFGQIDRRGGVGLIAAGVAGFAAGLLPYSLFLLFARTMYALGDSRTPALVALVCGATGVVAVTVGAMLTDGAARVGMIALGHSIAYAVGAIVLGRLLARRVTGGVLPARVAAPIALAAVLGLGSWLVLIAVAPQGRIQSAIAVVLIAVVGGGAYVGAVRWLGATTPRRLRGATA
jgi:putative peptidoglycan lipid II flippase